MLKIIEHKFISQELLDAVIDIKSTAWDYSYNSHLKWIKDNLKFDDLHFMVFIENEIIAYANLVNVVVIINNITTSFIGVGNVCTRYKGHGYGELLMNRLNQYLIENNLRGLLFCKKELIQFYKKNDWELISNLCSNISAFAMAFNFENTDSDIYYNDRSF